MPTWIETAAPAPKDWRCISIDSFGNKAVACVNGEYIYTCNDFYYSPDTWNNTTADTGNPGTDQWRSVAINSLGDKIVAISSNGNVALGTFGGLSWSWVVKSGDQIDGSLFPGTAWRWVASAGNGDTFVMAENDLQKLWITINSGTSWTQVTNSPTASWVTVALRTNGSDTVIIGTSATTIYWTIDSGANWSSYSPPGSDPIWVACGVNAGNNILYYSRGNQVYMYNFGTTVWDTYLSPIANTWNRITTDLSGENTIGVAGSFPAEVYVSENSGEWGSAQIVDPTNVVYVHGAPSLDGNRWGVVESSAVNGKIFKAGSFVCVSGETIVIQYKNGRTFQTQIKNIKAGDFVIDNKGNPVEVVFNIQGGFTKNYIKISKDSLGENKPDQDFFITKQHPLLVGNDEIECQKLVNGKDIVDITIEKGDNVYSLCTKNRIFVMMNNLEVCTWGEKEFLERSQKIGVSFNRQ